MIGVLHFFLIHKDALQVTNDQPVFRADLYLPCQSNCSQLMPQALAVFTQSSRNL